MDNDKLFPTKEAKDQAVLSLTNLINNPDFQLLCRIIDANVEVLTKALTESDFETLSEQKELRIKRQAYIDVKNTPDKIIRLFTQKDIPQESFDPYEQRPEVQQNG